MRYPLIRLGSICLNHSLFDCLNLPLVEFDILANRLCCQIAACSVCRFGKLFQALLGFCIDTNSKGVLHLYAPVHRLTQDITEAKEGVKVMGFLLSGVWKL